MPVFSETQIFGATIRESANDGSDFSNPPADYRVLFLGEDGLLHLRDSSGTVTDLGGSGGVTVQDEGTPLATAGTTLNFVGAGVAATGTGATKTITIAGGGGGGGIGEFATKYNPDHETPATTVAFQEEFNGSHGMAWDSAPGTNDITNYPGYLRFKGTTSARHLTKAWTPGATDITIACKLSLAMGTTSTGGVGLFVGNATGDPADAVYVILEMDSSSSAALDLYNENSSSFSLVATVAVQGGLPRHHPHLYLRLTRLNSGPTWTAYFSFNGITWWPLGTTGSKALTIGSFGIRTDCNHDVSVDWIRGWTSIVEKVGA